MRRVRRLRNLAEASRWVSWIVSDHRDILTEILGTLDSTLYTGDIEFIDIPSGQETYWVQTISCTCPILLHDVHLDLAVAITVGGQSIDIGSGSDVLAAIDTGTTLIGGPSASIAAIYAQVPGAQQGSGNFEGYYTFRECSPCRTLTGRRLMVLR